MVLFMHINGPVLRAVRQRTPGMSISKAAKAVGVSQPTWSNWESGRRNATPENIRAVMNLLAVEDPRVLVYGSPADPIELARLIDTEAA